MSDKQLREYLQTVSNEALVEMLMELASEDRDLTRRLSLQAAQGADVFDAKVFRRAIAAALISGSAADNRSSHPRTSRRWARSVDATIDPLDDLVGTANESHVIGIAEYALGRISTLMGRIDDSSGYFADHIRRLEELHHTACVNTGPHPVKLARRLFKFAVDGEWDIFDGCAKTYADVLGATGLAELQKLGDQRWAQLAPAPESSFGRDVPGAFHLTRMMVSLAEISGDVDAQVKIMARNLSHPYRFLEIAQLLVSHGRSAEALSWAEDGLDGSEDLPEHMRSDSRLDDFVLERYLVDERTESMLALVWRRFQDQPDLKTFTRLKLYGEHLGQWGTFRPRSLDLLQQRAAERQTKANSPKTKATPRPTWDRRMPPYDDLIGVLVFEGELDQAWQLAAEHGCSRQAWNGLAAASEIERPLDAAGVYLREIERSIDLKTTRSYEDAVAQLGTVRRLYEHAAQSSQFDMLIADTHRRHKQKTKFVRLLTEAGLWTQE